VKFSQKIKSTKQLLVSRLNNNNQKSTKVLPYLWIALVVIIFNLSSIGVDVIVLDDYAHYSEVVDGSLNTVRFNRGIINPFFWYTFIKILTYSPALARLSLVVLVMVPLALIIYYICRRYLRLPYIISAFSAIIFQILPNQAYIPTFIVGSYTTWALFILFISILFCLRYLKDEKNIDLMAALLFYFLAVEATELSIFLIFPLFVLLFGYKKLTKTHYILCSLLIIIATYKIIFVLINPYSDVTAPNIYSYKIIIERFYEFIIWSSPNPGVSEPLMVSICGILILGGLIFSINKPDKLNTIGYDDTMYLVKRKRLIWLLLFGLSWFIISFVPFATAKYFSNRYAYIPAFGFNFVLIFGIYSLFYREKLVKYHVTTVVLIILIIMTGIERNKNIKNTFKNAENVNLYVRKALSEYEFPKDSQIVISGPQIGYLLTGGYWNWSTGYLKYAIKRNDIAGLVGKENNFYDPFNPKERGYSYTMKGLDLSKPLFLFRLKNNQYVQLTFCLQWKNEEKVGEWNIYKIDPSDGIATLFEKGKGKTEYRNTLLTAGIDTKEVYWGG